MHGLCPHIMAHFGIPVSTQRLLYRGMRVFVNDTAESLGLEDNEEIDLMEEQSGD